MKWLYTTLCVIALLVVGVGYAPNTQSIVQVAVAATTVPQGGFNRGPNGDLGITCTDASGNIVSCGGGSTSSTCTLSQSISTAATVGYTLIAGDGTHTVTICSILILSSGSGSVGWSSSAANTCTTPSAIWFPGPVGSGGGYAIAKQDGLFSAPVGTYLCFNNNAAVAEVVSVSYGLH